MVRTSNSVPPARGLARCFAGACLAWVCAAAPVSAQAVPAPLTLDDAIQRALAKNYSIRVESFNVPIAKANVTAEWGRFDPNLQLRYEYSEDRNPQPTDPFSGARPPSFVSTSDRYEVGIGGLMPWGTQYRVGGFTQNQRGTANGFAHQYYSFSGVSIQQPLLRNFGLGTGLTFVRIAQTNRSMSEWEYREAITDTITQVIFAYHDLYLALENLRIAQRSRDLAANLLAENERRYEVGNVAQSDITTARSRVAFGDELILSSQRAVDYQTRLLRLLISDERSDAALSQPLVLTPPPPPPTVRSKPAEDFKVALENRPEYQRARLLLKRSRLNRSYEANQLLPQVDFVGSYGYYGIGTTWPESRRNLQERDAPAYTAGAVVTIPLTFTQERGRFRAARLQYRQAEAQVQQVEQQIVLEVGNAAAELENTQKRIEAARRAREFSQKSVDDVIKLHRVSNVSTLAVLQTQEYLAQAERAESRAIADAHKAVAEYERRIGRTLLSHRVQLTEPLSVALPPPRS